MKISDVKMNKNMCIVQNGLFYIEVEPKPNIPLLKKHGMTMYINKIKYGCRVEDSLLNHIDDFEILVEDYGINMQVKHIENEKVRTWITKLIKKFIIMEELD